jgi:hypothetical protein
VNTWTKDVRGSLYLRGIALSTEFLELNNLDVPAFVTYQFVADRNLINPQAQFFRRAVHLGLQGAATGRYTGLYYDHWVFVNVPHTAMPVQKPAVRAWSWPGWKTDRTALGVVAHEVGHHVECVWGPPLSRRWAEELKRNRKRPISGYEPTAGEAWAETLRLFILNPDLLRLGAPWRYRLLTGDAFLLKPIARLLKKGWRKVLNNPNYEPAAERWLGSAK